MKKYPMGIDRTEESVAVCWVGGGKTSSSFAITQIQDRGPWGRFESEAKHDLGLRTIPKLCSKLKDKLVAWEYG